MAQAKRPEIKEKDLQGSKYFERLVPLLARLHDHRVDRARNRVLHYDQYLGLLLFHYFTPILTSLRGIQQASELKKVQKLLGSSRAAIGTLSEASRVFDAELLQPIVEELHGQIQPSGIGTRELEALRNLTAVDGSLLPALPRMTWALWVSPNKRAAKMHMVFEVFRWNPVKFTITEGNGNEKDQLRRMLESGRLYVMDRGYAEYSLFQEILDAHSSFIGRIRDNAVWEVIEERPLDDRAKAAGVERDLVVRLGCPEKAGDIKKPIRVVVVRPDLVDTRNKDTLFLATDRLDLDADLVALGYRFRWSIELYFRWFKCVLGCKHLLSQDPNGIEIQVYVAVIAGLLITLWTQRKPSKRTFEMLCFYLCGLADEEELADHIRRLPVSVE
jgi:hypothetical protein